MLANMLGDLWGWIAEVVGRIGDMPVYWLVLALGLKTAFGYAETKALLSRSGREHATSEP